MREKLFGPQWRHRGGNVRKIGKLSYSLALFAGATLSTLAHSATWLKTGASTSRPYGHVEYCAKRPSECARQSAAKKLPAASLGTLKSVNGSVNRSIKPISDQAQFGVRERWSASAKSGDCEDYALAKRAALLRRGYRASNLLLAMGYAGSQAHTVLVVRTSDGDFVLDNLTDAVLPVGKARVGITKIQSPGNGGEWLRVTGRTSDPS